MQNWDKKQVKTCIWTAVITFLVSAILFVRLGMMLYNLSILGDTGSEVLTEVKRCIEAFYLEPYEDEELYYSAAKGMTDALDEYTTYFSPDEFTEFMNSTRGAYVGVGLVLTKTESGELLIMQAYEDCPGAEAGIKAGDVLVSVNGETYKDLDAAADALRGDGEEENGEGSQVKAVFSRDGKQYECTLTRREIHLKTVTYRMEENGVAYIKISAFDEDTQEEFKAAYDALKPQGISKIVLDLRDNGGGEYYAACDVAGMFLEEGQTVVYRKEKDGKCEYDYASGHCIDQPVVILANGQSASASEILIGALRGNKRLHALVGTNTFGKGVTQSVFELRSGGGISITASEYYSPDDKCIHGIGFAPDVEIETGYEEGYPVEAIERKDDVQLDKALEIVRGIK